MTITLEEAASKLDFLVGEVTQGEEIVLVRDNESLAKIVAVVPRRQRQPGSAQGLGWMATDFEVPLEDFKDYQ